MPKFEVEREEQGCMYRTYVVEAETLEEAEETFYETEPVSEYFKQHNANILSVTKKD